MRTINSGRLFSSVSSIALCACAVAWGCLASETSGTRPADAQRARLARKLIEGLNSDRYLVREKAKESLLKLGRAAIDPLEEASTSGVSEIRLRAVELLIALRGRGMLGVGMQDGRFDVLPEWGAGVKSLSSGMPAELAGIQTGDVIIALNGLPVPDNNELQHLVFVNGPARVMDVTVDRGGEKLHVPVLLTLNLTAPPLSVMQVDPPPIDLDSELPASDNPKARELARREMQERFTVGRGFVVQGNGMVVIQGNQGNVVIRQNVVVQNGGAIQGGVQSPEPAAPAPAPVAAPASDAKQIESDFEKAESDAQKDSDASDAEKAAK